MTHNMSNMHVTDEPKDKCCYIRLIDLPQHFISECPHLQIKLKAHFKCRQVAVILHLHFIIDRATLQSTVLVFAYQLQIN